MSTSTHVAATSRSVILETAKRLFAKRGLHVVTMLDIAKAAKVSRATVFNQFGSKSAVLDAIAADVLEGYLRLLDAALADKTTETSRLIVELAERMGRGIAADREFYRTFFNEIAKVSMGLDEGSDAQRVRHAAFDRLVRLFLRAQARGDVIRDAEAESLASVFDSLVFGTIARWLHQELAEPELPEHMRSACMIFLKGASRDSASRGTATPRRARR